MNSEIHYASNFQRSKGSRYSLFLSPLPLNFDVPIHYRYSSFNIRHLSLPHFDISNSLSIFVIQYPPFLSFPLTSIFLIHYRYSIFNIRRFSPPLSHRYSIFNIRPPLLSSLRYSIFVIDIRYSFPSFLPMPHTNH